MGKKEIISYFKKGKIVQLVVVILIAVVFFLTLLCNSTLRSNIYSNNSLFTLCAFVWFLLILGFISIFIDFYRLNRFSSAEDKSELSRYMEASSGMLNRFSCDTLFNSEEVTAVLSKVGCAMLEISNLKQINEEKGRDAGDIAIKDFCDMLESVGNDFGIVVRNGGNEFLIVIADCTTSLMNTCLEQLNNSVALYNETECGNELEIRSTYVLNSEKSFTRFSEVLTLAYKQLHSES